MIYKVNSGHIYIYIYIDVINPLHFNKKTTYIEVNNTASMAYGGPALTPKNV